MQEKGSQTNNYSILKNESNHTMANSGDLEVNHNFGSSHHVSDIQRAELSENCYIYLKKGNKRKNV